MKILSNYQCPILTGHHALDMYDRLLVIFSTFHVLGVYKFIVS